MMKLMLQCHKHPNYNPAKNGQGGIKGGCDLCFALFQIHSQIEMLKGLPPKQFWDGFGSYNLPLLLTFTRKIQRQMAKIVARTSDNSPAATREEGPLFGG